VECFFWEINCSIIIIMIRFWKKKEETISRENPGFEEDERRTPKTGLLLLLVMVVAGLFFGWRALDDIARLPQAPEVLSYCSAGFRGQTLLADRIVFSVEPPIFYDERYYTKYTDESIQCQFNELEKQAGVSVIFLERDAALKETKPLRDSLDEKTAQLNEVRYQIERITREYSVGLDERSAQVEQPLFPIGQTAPSLQVLRSQDRQLVQEKQALENQLKSFDGQLKAIDDRLIAAYKPVLKAYNRQLRWYEFKIFVSQMVLVLPLFWIVFGLYVRLHRKNSPYTLIATAMVVVASVLFLRVMLVWFWGLFLQSLLETLWEWIQRFRILQSLVFYGGMILSFVVFGGAVYYLQKKIFDPRRVAIRRFRQKQCPKCQASLDLAGEFCPNCGYQLKKKCASCGNSRFSDLPICPHCGAKE